VVFAGKLLASDGASRGAEDEAISRQGGGMQAGVDGEKDGLQEERRDGDQGDAVFVSAQPTHGYL
jgi:hypothetical protein